MTRKDYELIAAALQTARADIIDKESAESHEDLLRGVSWATEFLAYALKHENSAFNTKRFFDAAGWLDECPEVPTEADALNAAGAQS